jgi:hypothetical protein
MQSLLRVLIGLMSFLWVLIFLPLNSSFAQTSDKVRAYGLCAVTKFDYNEERRAFSQAMVSDIFAVEMSAQEYLDNLPKMEGYRTNIQGGPTVDRLIREFAKVAVPGQPVTQNGDYLWGPPHRTNPNGSGFLWCKLSTDQQLIANDLARHLDNRDVVGRVSFAPASGSQQKSATRSAEAAAAKQQDARQAASAQSKAAQPAPKKAAAAPAKKSTCTGKSCGVH